MARPDISALREAAGKAIERGKLDKALELYAELERAEPAAPGWPKRIAETHRRLGAVPAAVAAFQRAVEKYVQVGFLVQAIAVCKLILQLDPEDSTTVQRLAELAGPPAAAARPPHAAAPMRLPPGAALDALDLSKLPGARHLPNAAGGHSGISVLPAEAVAFEELELRAEDIVAGPQLAPAARLALVTTPLFARLPAGVLERLITRLDLVHLDADEVLFRAGDPGACLYVIGEGEVIVESDDRELARLGPSAFFGEIALVTDQPRTATIRAATRTELLAIDRDLVREVVAEHPEIVNVLLGFVRDRLVDRITRTSELFRPFADQERAELCAKFDVVEVMAGSELIVQGARGDGLYIVLAGTVDVARDGRSIATLRTGDVFGEMSLLWGGGSTARVCAVTRVLALRMPAFTFQEVIMTHPHVLAYLGDLAARRAEPTANDAFSDLHIDMLA